MKYIVNGGERLSGKLNITGSSYSAGALISLSLLCSSSSKLENIPMCYGLERLITILTPIFPKIERSQNNNLTIDPTVLTSIKKVEILLDADPEVFFALPALISKNIQVVLGGSKNSFAIHRSVLELLKLLDLSTETSLHNLTITKPQKIKENYHLDFGGNNELEATLAILFAVTLNTTISIINYPRNPSFLQFLEALKQCNIAVDTNTTTNDSETVEIKSANLPTTGVQTTTFFCDKLATFYAFASMGTLGDIALLGVNHKDLMPFCAKILPWGAMLDPISSNELKIYAQKNKLEETVAFEVKSYPGFIDLWGYLALVYLLSTQNTVSLVFPNSAILQIFVKELNRVGANLDLVLVGNFVRVVSLKKPELASKKIIIDDRELILPFVLLALLHKGKTVLGNGEIIDSYYPDLIENLKLLGANLETD